MTEVLQTPVENLIPKAENLKEQAKNAPKAPELKLEEAKKEKIEIEKKVVSNLKKYEKALFVKFNLSESNPDRNPKALNLYKNMQILRAQINNASFKKLEQLVNKYNGLLNDVQELIGESSQKISENSMSKAFPKENYVHPLAEEPASNPGISDEDNLAHLDELLDLPATPSSQETTPDIPTNSPGESVVDSLTGVKIDLSSGIKQAEEEGLKEDEEQQKENQITELLDQINSDSEPQKSSKLVRGLWKQVHESGLGIIRSVSAHTDNANLVVEYSNGDKKLVSPELIAKYSARSVSAFNEKALSKAPNYQEEVIEFAFDGRGGSDTSEQQDKPASAPDDGKLQELLASSSGSASLKKGNTIRL